MYLVNQSTASGPTQRAPQENCCDLFADINNVDINERVDKTVHLEGTWVGGSVAGNVNATELHDLNNELARDAAIVGTDLCADKLINNEGN